MAGITIVYGVILIVLGVGGYFGSGGASITALFPAFFGIPITICGFVAKKEHLRKHAMHGAVLLGLLGALGTARGLPGFFQWITGGDVERPMAVIAQTVMFVLSAGFVVLCVRSFIAARKAMTS